MNKNYKYLKYIIDTASGLQKVDGLETSSYFKKASEKYLKEECSIDELYQLIESYYKAKPDSDCKQIEADKVAVNIASVLEENGFTFTPGQFLSIHKRLFDNVFPHAGKMREYNFSKEEWVLNGDSVAYGDYRELIDTLNYDFLMEKDYQYKNKTIDEVISHLATFVANLWQIHIFEEGNTRTTAVFLIKYLRTLGFNLTNEQFAQNACYFRNALVRANYTNIKKGIYADQSYLILFLRNLLLGERNVLDNKHLHVSFENMESAALSEAEKKVLSLIQINPHITATELADSICKSPRTVKSICASLKLKGCIERINGKNKGYWKVK